MDEMITITQEEYDDLINDRDFLLCLFASGVEEWEGYEGAIQMAIEEE